MTLVPLANLSHSTSAKQIEDRLLEFAIAHAARFGYKFAPKSEQYIKSIIKTAGQEISEKSINDKSSARIELYIRQSEGALSFLIEKMIYHALTTESIRTKEPGIIGEDTYQFALGLLCPCWPFC